MREGRDSLPYRWLDITPTSRAVTRCTRDIQAGKSIYLASCRVLRTESRYPVDGEVASQFDWLCECPNIGAPQNSPFRQLIQVWA